MEVEVTVNRKLIRPTLADIKKGPQQMPPPQRPRQNGSPPRSGSDGSHAPQRPAQQSGAVQVRKRTPPPAETNAEIFYYKKQIDAHTPMVIVLQGGEEIEGTIEWYDRSALKVNRKAAPNLLVLKHNIKYMYKVEDRVAPESPA
jgi:sRNA-binding regulator protein Hfq